MTETLTVYGKTNCKQCDATVRKLEALNIQFEYLDATTDEALRSKVVEYGYLQFPVVVANEDEHWAGYRPDLIEQYA